MFNKTYLIGGSCCDQKVEGVSPEIAALVERIMIVGLQLRDSDGNAVHFRMPAPVAHILAQAMLADDPVAYLTAVGTVNEENPS